MPNPVFYSIGPRCSIDRNLFLSIAKQMIYVGDWVSQSPCAGRGLSQTLVLSGTALSQTLVLSGTALNYWDNTPVVGDATAF